MQEMADYMRSRFERRFAKSGEYLVVRGNGPKTLVVELALVELNPSNFAGNIVKTGGSVFVPGVGFLGSQFTRGGIAIEGKIRNGETGELLVEFADRQQDRTTLFSFRDFTPYAHDRAAIDDWAKQLDRLSRTPSTYRVRGSLGVALNPF